MSRNLQFFQDFKRLLVHSELQWVFSPYSLFNGYVNNISLSINVSKSTLSLIEQNLIKCKKDSSKKFLVTNQWLVKTKRLIIKSKLDFFIYNFPFAILKKGLLKIRCKCFNQQKTELPKKRSLSVSLGSSVFLFITFLILEILRLLKELFSHVSASFYVQSVALAFPSAYIWCKTLFLINLFECRLTVTYRTENKLY